MDDSRDFFAGPDDGGRRLDKVLRRFLPEVPLSALYKAIRRGRIRVNHSKARPEDRLAQGDCLSLDLSLFGKEGKKPEGTRRLTNSLEGAEAQDDLSVLEDYLIFASRDLLILNKPQGMPSHGPGGLELLVRAALAKRSTASLSFVPGPLHRLDRNTSGLIAFPRSAAGARVFTALLRERRLRKHYLALVRSTMRREEIWEDLLVRDSRRGVTLVLPKEMVASGDATPARSRALPLLSASGLSLLLVELETGLTHQIRAQAASRGYPLAGDRKYGGGASYPGGYMLHAWLLDFGTPPFPDLPARIEAPLAVPARERLASLFGASELEEALETIRKG